MSTTNTDKPKGQGWFSRSDLEAKVARLEAELAAAKAAPSAPVAARLVETAARQTAAELSATRRASDNTLTRGEFNALKPADRVEFLQGKGTITENAPKAPSVGSVTAAEHLASLAKPTMTRSEFNKLPHAERSAAVKKFKLID